MKHTLRTVMSLTALAAFALPSSARATGTPVIVAGPGSYITNYTQSVVVAQPGDSITYINADVQPHDVIARELGPDTPAFCGEDADMFTPGVQRRYELGSCPLFWTNLISVSGSTPVLGLENIQGGGTLYDFYCSIHPNMRGTLVAV